MVGFSGDRLENCIDFLEGANASVLPVCRATQKSAVGGGGQSGELLIWAAEQHCMSKSNQAIILGNLEEQSDRSSTETILG